MLREREFQALLGSSALSVLGDQVARIAVALLVWDRTGSSLAAAATYACGYLTWLLAGPVLAALADRLPRRRLMVVSDLLRAALVAGLVLPGVPLPVVFVVLVAVALLSPPYDAAKSAVLPEILEGDRYVVGNAVLSNVLQGANAGGFLVGGLVVAGLGTRGALALDAVSFVVSALVLTVGLQERPLPERAPVPLLADTVEGVRLVAGDPVLRRLLGFGLLGSIVMIAPEGLAVPVAAATGGGAVATGVLTSAVPVGFLLGSALLVRVPPARRLELLPALVVLAGGALLLTPVLPGLAAATGLWVVAGAGAALSIVANAAYMQAVPPGLRGRAYGVADAALMALQGVTLLAVGVLAEPLDARVVVALAGVVARRRRRAAGATAGPCRLRLAGRPRSAHEPGTGRHPAARRRRRPARARHPRRRRGPRAAPAAPRLPGPVPAPWWGLLILYVLAEQVTLGFQRRDSSLVVVLVQLPLALGAVLVAPAAHLLVRLLSVVVDGALHRRFGLKLVVNLGAAALEVGLVYAVLAALHPQSLRARCCGGRCSSGCSRATWPASSSWRGSSGSASCRAVASRCSSRSGRHCSSRPRSPGSRC